MSGANIFASIIFGSIGLAAFIYGKKQSSFKPLLVGILLMAYPYFVQNTAANYVIGTMLTVFLLLPIGS
jgi:hypothetical protein